MGKMSREKGKRGERQARDQAKKHWNSGDGCIRAAQSNGKYSCDILNALPNAHVEVKLYKRIVALDFLAQATDDAQEGELPIVLMRENGKTDWVCMFRVKDSKNFMQQLCTNIGEIVVPHKKD